MSWSKEIPATPTATRTAGFAAQSLALRTVDEFVARDGWRAVEFRVAFRGRPDSVFRFGTVNRRGWGYHDLVERRIMFMLAAANRGG